MYKKAWCTCKIVVLVIKPIAFVEFPFPSPSSDLKVPTVWLAIDFFFRDTTMAKILCALLALALLADLISPGNAWLERRRRRRRRRVSAPSTPIPATTEAPTTTTEPSTTAAPFGTTEPPITIDLDLVDQCEGWTLHIYSWLEMCCTQISSLRKVYKIMSTVLL